MIAVLGGLGAAAAWAISTLCSSRSSRIIDPTSVVAWVMASGLVVAVPAVIAAGVPAHLDGAPGGWLLVSGGANVAGLMLAYRAMRVGQVSLVAPLVSTEGAIAAVIALIAGESIAPAVAAALAMIAAGVVVASVPPPEVDSAGAPGRDPAHRGAEHHRAAFGFAAGAALLFGASLYATGKAGAALPSAWVALPARVIGTAVLLVPLGISRRLARPGRALPFVLASGIAEVAGFYAYTAGARHGIAVAAVLSSQFATLSVLVAYVLFKERLGQLQLAGVITVIVGVALLSALRA
jgi:drug/metabolite transporter (DMT)-like permease